MLNLVYADKEGLAYDDIRHRAVGRSGQTFVEVDTEEFIPMPSGSSLMVLPDRYPLGINIKENSFKPVTDRGFAVAALLPQGYTRTYLPAYVKGKGASQLPLFGYTAVAWNSEEECFYVAAVHTDVDSNKWSPTFYNTANLRTLVDQKTSQHKGNRIIKQLAKCALEYGCFTAQNIFYERWEGGVPASPVCNAACVGCISQQPSECCPAPQGRIKFTPTQAEMSEIMLSHLDRAEQGIISFGQGCEGEPLLQAETIAAAIREVRGQCDKGTINANTNAGYTEGVKMVCGAGIDSLRVSLISAIPEHYDRYYNPRGNYQLKDVATSIKVARANNVFVSLNLLMMPGVIDTETELSCLIDFVKETDVNMIQFRNLNLDPDMYANIYSKVFEYEPLGVESMIGILREELPGVRLGNFSRPLRGD